MWVEQGEAFTTVGVAYRKQREGVLHTSKLFGTVNALYHGHCK